MAEDFIGRAIGDFDVIFREFSMEIIAPDGTSIELGFKDCKQLNFIMSQMMTNWNRRLRGAEEKPISTSPIWTGDYDEYLRDSHNGYGRNTDEPDKFDPGINGSQDKLL